MTSKAKRKEQELAVLENRVFRDVLNKSSLPEREFLRTQIFRLITEMSKRGEQLTYVEALSLLGKIAMVLYESDNDLRKSRNL